MTVRSVVRYLLVDDRDGSVLAELTNAQEAVRVLIRNGRELARDPRVRVVRLEYQQGGLSDTTSMVSMRPLPPLVPCGGRSKPFPERPLAI